MHYGIVIEKLESNSSADVPDLPGCVATGATIEEIQQQIKEASAFHLDG
ncbi:MAG: type II toxin-antitoxin system HicB family antitoxin [Symploca sp. SIO1B1]|nr:type II toxin-antitoxin system HicB family antitoxin [Symploca sp. SIO1B1]